MLDAGGVVGRSGCRCVGRGGITWVVLGRLSIRGCRGSMVWSSIAIWGGMVWRSIAIWGSGPRPRLPPVSCPGTQHASRRRGDARDHRVLLGPVAALVPPARDALVVAPVGLVHQLRLLGL